MSDYDISRFVVPQQNNYAQALSEIKAGHKNSHWIWFIFPQLDGLVRYPSYYTELYSIKSLDEARAFLADEYLGGNLIEITTALLDLPTDSPYAVVEGDAVKVKSCMTLFELVSEDNSVFSRVLDKYFKGQRDEKTLKLLGM